MKKLSIGLFLALIGAALLAVPAVARNHGVSQGAGGFGLVDGHLEGANPVAARLCVDFPNGDFVCEVMVRPDTSGMGITIPKPFIGSATFSAWVGPDLGDLHAAVDSLTGAPCVKVSIAEAGMARCQDSATEEVKRVNVYWTTNSAKGMRDRGADGTTP